MIMTNITLSIDKALGALPNATIGNYAEKASQALQVLHNGTGKGNEFLGWLNLPSDISEQEMTAMEKTAERLRKQCEIIFVIGIGGSYLGAKAIIEALSDLFSWLKHTKDDPIIVFAGQNISEDYLFELQNLLKNKKFGIVCISKSGTTTEPALAFRLLKKQLEDQQGKAAGKDLIVCITDKSRGALRTLATQEGYETYVIADDVGGRFS